MAERKLSIEEKEEYWTCEVVRLSELYPHAFFQVEVDDYTDQEGNPRISVGDFPKTPDEIT